MEHLRRYQRVWRLLHRVLPPVVRRKVDCDLEPCRAQGTFLVLANHNTDWDPILLGLAFPEYMSFVASEHIFRWGLSSWLIRFLLNPIARLKGGTAGDTAMTVLRRLKQGINVAMFAEGNRSFNGLTGDILPATGKLARSSGAGLITYRFDGGYFLSPRWSGSKLRRGRLRGRVVHVYTPEELKAMSAAQVNEAIRRDLFVDAYAVQRREMQPYLADAPAEHLETVLCRCPRCGALELHSAGDSLSCGCGFSVRYNDYGFLEGPEAPFDNITDWDQAQTEALCALADATPPEAPIFRDEQMQLREILPRHKSAVLGRGPMALYRDRLECCGSVFPLDQLSGLAIHGPQTLDLRFDDRSFELSSDQVRCTRKYLTVIDHLRQGC